MKTYLKRYIKRWISSAFPDAEVNFDGIKALISPTSYETYKLSFVPAMDDKESVLLRFELPQYEDVFLPIPEGAFLENGILSMDELPFSEVEDYLSRHVNDGDYFESLSDRVIRMCELYKVSPSDVPDEKCTGLQMKLLAFFYDEPDDSYISYFS